MLALKLDYLSLPMYILYEKCTSLIKRISRKYLNYLILIVFAENIYVIFIHS